MAAAFAALCAAVVALLLLPSALRLVRHVYQVCRIMRLTRDVPGPPSWPLLGCVPAFLAVWSDMHNALKDMLKRYGTTFRMQVFDRVVLVVMDPDDVQVVCTHPALANKAWHYKLLNHHLGQGLITMNGPAYKRHRKAITPSLHLDILQDFVPVFAKNAEAMAGRLQFMADTGNVFDASREFGKLANTTIMESLLAMRRDGASEDEYAAMVEVLTETSEVIMWRVVRPWWQSDLLFRLSSRFKTFRHTAVAMNAMVSNILQFKSDEVASGVAPPPRRRMAFLDHVLRSAESATMSEEELRDELKTFLFAGSTTSMDYLALVALAFTMYPDVQRQVQQELDEIFGAADEGPQRAVSADDLAHMHYTERVLREVLRYAPPVPAVFRVASEDVKLPGGALVPQGCMVALVPAGTHRIAAHFPDPLRFDPDRFLAENTRGRHPFAYIPFSAGSRNCVGQRYALMFAKTAVATLLRRYSFLPAPGGPRHFGEVNVEPGITIAVRGGALVRVQHRSTPSASAADSPTATAQ